MKANYSPPPANVYIASTSFSGSTLLGHALNAHSEVFHAGEMGRLTPDKVDEVLPTFTECMLCAMKGEPCPIWTPETRDQLKRGAYRNRFQTVRDRVEKPIIVDGTKVLGALTNTLNDSQTELFKVILLTRHPGAFIRSVRRNTSPKSPKVQAFKSAYTWYSVYQHAINLCLLHGTPFLLLRYEDLCLDPHRSLRRVCDFLGIEFEPRMLEYWSEPCHSIGGNPTSYKWFEGFHPESFPNAAWKESAQRFEEKKISAAHIFDWRKSFGFWDAVACRVFTKGLIRKFSYRKELFQPYLDAHWPRVAKWFESLMTFSRQLNGAEA